MKLNKAIVALALIGGLSAACTVTPVHAGNQPIARQDSTFGTRLAASARRQTWVPVIYNPAYRKIDYPMGDVPWYFGVCTDVVVRAYRRHGIDLQELVHKARVGSGDTNIDHRRVPVLKTFFQRMGAALPVSSRGEDYRAGDIVIYHLPEGRSSKTHIAIVSDRKSSAGNPLIIHNIGYGVQEEDWLFGAPIAGHFRFGAGIEARRGE